MKVKRDFVTNSSSTSFIVADLRNEEDRKTLMVDYDWGSIDLLKILETKTVSSYEEFLEEWGDEDKRVKNVFKKGGIIYILRAHDAGAGAENPLEAGFCNMGINDCVTPSGVEVLEGDGGY